jgi:hypothetical protein
MKHFTDILRHARLCVLPALFLCGQAVAQDAYEHYPVATGERQLFLDDFFLGAVYNVKRTIHQPQKYEGNPVVRADQPWEGSSIQIRSAPVWDPRDEIYKMWYFGPHRTGLAVSDDGIRWRKPALGLRDHQGSKQNNLVVVKEDPEAFVQHVILDPDAEPQRRYKGLTGWRNRRPLVSADGRVFHLLDAPAIPSQDESHLNYDEKAKRYIATVKQRGPFGRSVYLSTSTDFERWTSPKVIFHADALDQELGRRRMREHFANPKLYTPFINKPEEYNVEIYNMPVFPYEGIYVGLPNFFESSGLTPMPHNNQDGVNSVKLATSRDLLRWTKVGNRASFIPVSDFNDKNLDSVQILAASRPLAVNDELWFYYTGINRRYSPDGSGAGGIHLAKLRRDGFVSFHAGDEGGFIETRAIRFTGSNLFVNVDASEGEVRVEVVDARGREVLEGWGREKCTPVRGDQMRERISWEGQDIESLVGKTVRFRFHIRAAHLYSFWLEK